MLNHLKNFILLLYDWTINERYTSAISACVFRRKWAMIPVQNGQAHRDYLWGSRSEATLAF
jgi:hypothetical protein